MLYVCDGVKPPARYCVVKPPTPQRGLGDSDVCFENAARWCTPLPGRTGLFEFCHPAGSSEWAGTNRHAVAWSFFFSRAESIQRSVRVCLTFLKRFCIAAFLPGSGRNRRYCNGLRLKPTFDVRRKPTTLATGNADGFRKLTDTSSGLSQPSVDR